MSSLYRSTRLIHPSVLAHKFLVVAVTSASLIALISCFTVNPVDHLSRLRRRPKL